MKADRSTIIKAVALVCIILSVRMCVEMVQTRRAEASSQSALADRSQPEAIVKLDSLATADSILKSEEKKQKRSRKKKTGHKPAQRKPAERDFLGEPIPSNQ